MYRKKSNIDSGVQRLGAFTVSGDPRPSIKLYENYVCAGTYPTTNKDTQLKIQKILLGPEGD